jgi:nucleoside-diphosphate-sugar epimerase
MGVAISQQHFLVTGGAGFIGTHLCRALLARGARVTAIDSMKYARERDFPVRRFTLGTDAIDTLPLDDVAGIFHLAAEKHNQSLATPDALFSANINGTHQLLTAAACAGVRKVVFSSSLYAYGRMHGPPMREDDLPAPATLYGITKLTGERLIAHARTLGLPGTVLRYFFVYGPEQFPGMGYKSVIVANFERLLAGQPALVHGDGTQALDYIYVDDVVDATLRAMERDVDGPLNVGSGVATSINDLTARMVAMTRGGIEHDAADWTAGSSRVGDVSRIRAALDWQPRVGLDEGLARTLAWLRANPH